MGWLSKVKNEKNKATGGRSALKDHAKGKKHGDLAVKIKTFLNLFLRKPSPELKLVMIIREHRKIIPQSGSFKAVIIWLLNCVMSVCFLRFSDDLGDKLCAMHAGVESVKNFRFARSKAMYSVNHGLALTSGHCLKQP